MTETVTREPHVCEPHHRDRFDGWTNCWVCFKVIRFDGPPGEQCHVVIPWTGPCELRVGHTGRHSVGGILFNF